MAYDPEVDYLPCPLLRFISHAAAPIIAIVAMMPGAGRPGIDDFRVGVGVGDWVWDGVAVSAASGSSVGLSVSDSLISGGTIPYPRAAFVDELTIARLPNRMVSDLK